MTSSPPFPPSLFSSFPRLHIVTNERCRLTGSKRRNENERDFASIRYEMQRRRGERERKEKEGEREGRVRGEKERVRGVEREGERGESEGRKREREGERGEIERIKSERKETVRVPATLPSATVSSVAVSSLPYLAWR